MDIYFHSFNKSNFKMLKHVGFQSFKIRIQINCLSLHHARGEFRKGKVTEAMCSPSHWTQDSGRGPWQKASALGRLSETRKAVTFAAKSTKGKCLWHHPATPTLQTVTSNPFCKCNYTSWTQFKSDEIFMI